MEARLLTKTIKGKERQILTSLTDPMKYPASDIVDLYSHRWEIELGYREMKQYLLESRFTLRSQLPELVKQELWGILLSEIPSFFDTQIIPSVRVYKRCCFR
jgi:IS4 transposase